MSREDLSEGASDAAREPLGVELARLRGAVTRLRGELRRLRPEVHGRVRALRDVLPQGGTAQQVVHAAVTRAGDFELDVFTDTRCRLLMLNIEDELDAWTPHYVAVILATESAQAWSYVVFMRDSPEGDALTEKQTARVGDD